MFEDRGVQLRRTFCSTNTEAIKNAVIRGRGIAIFSRRMIEKEAEDGSIVILPLKEISVTRNIHLAIHKNKYLSEEIKVLQEILLSSC